MHQRCTVRRALLSVYDKNGIIQFAKKLFDLGIEILSTGGTAKILLDAGIPIIEVSSYTAFPEIMNGRIKTLHYKIHAGILGRRNEDIPIMEKHEILPIDMVVVNLYPFMNKISMDNCSLEDAIENIDIGGQTMMRSAAKNYKNVAIIIDNSDYDHVLFELNNNNNSLTLKTRLSLAIKAFQYTTSYDSVIANYLNNTNNSNFPSIINLHFIKKYDLCYGENFHQNGAFYIDKNIEEGSIAGSQQLQGKNLSYNNIVDSNTALECVREFDKPACVIVKHGNPCSVALGNTILEAYNRAYFADSVSAFGSIIAFNCELDEITAKTIINRQFVEVIIAPVISKNALIITSTKQKIRILLCGKWKNNRIKRFNYKSVNGGILVQDQDLSVVRINKLQIVSKRYPTKEELSDALFSWKIVKFVKSNAIVYARNNMTIGIGAGQMSRIDSAKIASIKANHSGLDIKGATMASDAFLPFKDTIENAAIDGISCVIQPGGSIRDDEIIDAANQYNIAMIFTKIRHFYH